MKKYLCFVTDCEQGGGGWDDFIGDFDTIEELTAAAKAAVVVDAGYAEEVQIVDRDTKQVVRGDLYFSVNKEVLGGRPRG